jgi:hypothetical protein
MIPEIIRVLTLKLLHQKAFVLEANLQTYQLVVGREDADPENSDGIKRQLLKMFHFFG